MQRLGTAASNASPADQEEVVKRSAWFLRQASVEDAEFGLIGASARSTSAIKVTDDEHEHGNFLLLDLDEVAHAANAAFQSILKATRDGPQHLTASFMEEDKAWRDNAFEALRHDASSSHASDFLVATGISVATLPLAWLALKAGLEEALAARRQLRVLNQRGTALITHADRLKKAQQLVFEVLRKAPADSPLGQVAAALQRLNNHELQGVAQQQKDLTECIRNKRSDKSIGLRSLASGAAIFLKSTLDLAVKAALAIEAKGLTTAAVLGQKASLATATSVVGFAGSAVLAPFAAVLAFALGKAFVAKSNRCVARLEKDQIASSRHRYHIDSLLEKSDAAQSTPPDSTQDTKRTLADYRDFLNRKFPQRMKFMKYFQRWNRRFLKGSVLYGLSALPKAALTTAILFFGATLLSNPIGWGVLLGVGIAGAVLMGFASHQFFFGHHQQSRYDQYVIQDHAWLDRQWLSRLDTLHRQLPPTAVNSNADLETLGFRTRASFHRMLVRLREADQALLSAWREQTRCARGPGATRRLGRWLEKSTPIAYQARRKALSAALQAHTDYLAEAVEARLVAHAALLDSEADDQFEIVSDDVDNNCPSPLSESIVEPIAEPKNTFSEMQAATTLIQLYTADAVRIDHTINQEQKRLETLRDLLHRTQKAENPAQLAELEQAFLEQTMTVQAVSTPSSRAKNPGKALAHYWRTTLPHTLQDLRGMLLETELQAARALPGTTTS